jgi:aminoglycoside phosphotransferase (APT) family kinase protein
MADRPAAEFAIDEALVWALLRSQAPGLLVGRAHDPLRLVSAGWDNEIWRLGDDLAVRMPRRALSARLIEHERIALPVLAPKLTKLGVAAPLPLHSGVPGNGYPWPWAVTAWTEGVRAMDTERASRASWAGQLAGAVSAIHRPAPPEYPANPYRGVPLVVRDEVVATRISALGDSGTITPAQERTAHALWRRGVDSPRWSGPAVWIHGDLHPGNLLVSGDRLVAVIDFGDVTAGDPAYDLAIAWLAFDELGRAAFRDATDARYDGHTWTRAHAWAVAVTAMLLAHSDDNPDYAALGREALAIVVGDG